MYKLIGVNLENGNTHYFISINSVKFRYIIIVKKPNFFLIKGVTCQRFSKYRSKNQFPKQKLPLNFFNHTLLGFLRSTIDILYVIAVSKRMIILLYSHLRLMRQKNKI